MGLSPASILYDTASNAIKSIQDGADYLLGIAAKLRNAAGTIINPATEDTLTTIDSVLDSIKDTDGIKKITDPLPAGTNNIGDVDLASSIPSGTNIIGRTITRSGDKGTSVAADLTSNPIDANTEALHIDGSKVTQPISATSLPLPTGAATASNQTDGSQKAQVVDGSDVLDINISGQAAIQNPPNLDVALSTRATETTLSAADTKLGTIDSTLDSIKDTDGIKKITDALPTGDNWIGRVRLGDGTNPVGVFTDGDTLSDSEYTLAKFVGRDSENKARFLLTEADGTLRTASQPPSAPPGTTEFVLAIDEADLEIGAPPTYHEEESSVIGSGVELYLQLFVAGAAGDPSERGSRVDILWREGAGPTDHVIERAYVSGQSVTTILPDVNKARDGTTLSGNGTNTKLVIRRYRLSNSDQEVDAIVRGYTE